MIKLTKEEGVFLKKSTKVFLVLTKEYKRMSKIVRELDTVQYSYPNKCLIKFKKLNLVRKKKAGPRRAFYKLTEDGQGIKEIFVKMDKMLLNKTINTR